MLPIPCVYKQIRLRNTNLFRNPNRREKLWPSLYQEMFIVIEILIALRHQRANTTFTRYLNAKIPIFAANDIVYSAICHHGLFGLQSLERGATESNGLFSVQKRRKWGTPTTYTLLFLPRRHIKMIIFDTLITKQITLI